MDNERYFTGIRREYQEAIDFSAEIYGNIAAVLNELLRGRVTDFGNGGIIHYSTDRIDRLLCVDLVEHQAPEGDSSIEFVRGDFLEFSIPADTDVVLAQFLLHHLPDDALLDAALARLGEDLDGDGRFVIVEMLLPRFAEMTQSLLRPLLFALLRATGKPELRFFSLGTLKSRLTQAGFGNIEVTRVSVGRRIAPAPVLFPKLRIPGWLYPLRCAVLVAHQR